jgi:hypothetical protein
VIIHCKEPGCGEEIILDLDRGRVWAFVGGPDPDPDLDGDDGDEGDCYVLECPRGHVHSSRL